MYPFCVKRMVLSISLLLLQCLIVPAAQAVVVEDLYRVEFTVPDQSRKVRAAVFTKGLEQVLIRVSGRRTILQEIKTGSASSYVQQYSYSEQLPETRDASDTGSVNDVGTASAQGYVLSVEYNAGKITKLLRDNNQPVWGEHRSEVLIWLAVRDGVNRYVLKDADSSLLKDAASNSTKRRGLPLIWPVYDQQDQNRMRFVDAWAAFERPVKDASKRYTNGPVIVGRMSWTGSEWNGSWSLFVDNSSYEWTLNSNDYNTLIAEAIDLAADEIGKRYAVLDRQGMTEPGLLVEVGNIGSAEDFRTTQIFFEGLTAVRQTRVVRVDNGSVLFMVDLRGDVDDFVRQVSTDKILEPMVESIQSGSDPEQSVRLRYLYRK